MFAINEKSCFDRDKSCAEKKKNPHFDPMVDRWHPAIRMLIIVGSATMLWAFVLAAII